MKKGDPIVGKKVCRPIAAPLVPHAVSMGVVAFVFLLLAVCTTCAQPPSWWSSVIKVQLGQSREEVRQKMSDFEFGHSRELLQRYERRLGFLSGTSMDVWVVDMNTIQAEGGKTYIMACYTDNGRVLDLLRFRAAGFLWPLVKGQYAVRLESIGIGMNVDSVYRLLGENSPYRYFRDEKTREWKVEIVYQGVGPDFWSYIADAASGKISEVHRSSI